NMICVDRKGMTYGGGGPNYFLVVNEHRNGVRMADGQQGKTVLVFIRQITEGSKKCIPSVVWLNSLDEVPGGCRDTVFRQVRKSFWIERIGFGDWEIRAVFLRNQGARRVSSG